MSTIPTTSRRPRIPYTIVGGTRGTEGGAPFAGVTLCLLNRGGRLYRAELYTELVNLGFAEILSVEGPANSYDIENLSLRFPTIRFLLLHERATSGEMVNIGIDEARENYVLVLWNDMRIAPGSLSFKLLERSASLQSLCVVPILQNHRNETIPSIQAPAFMEGFSGSFPWLLPRTEPSPLPVRFLRAVQQGTVHPDGRFRPPLGNPYWQKMDFGFRSFMWGERIVCNTALRFSYLIDPEHEDATPDESYRLFYLKNLAFGIAGTRGLSPVGSSSPTGSSPVSVSRPLFGNSGKCGSGSASTRTASNRTPGESRNYGRYRMYEGSHPAGPSRFHEAPR
jgi:hypothetical protein